LLTSWHDAGEAPPTILVLPPAAASLDEAHSAIEQWEYYSRKTLDPPQCLAVELMLAESANGRWAARTTGREMARQNGKGDEIEVVEFWALTQREEAILHTAHELNTVSSAHQRMVALLSHKDFRGKRQPKILNGIGQQMISMGDAVIQYRTRTAGGGRGLDDISRLVVDEAQHARPEQLASATPTLLANPNPQMNFIGTGAITGVSDWWWSLRVRALGPSPGDFAYCGHTAETVTVDASGAVTQKPVDASDRSIWRGPNPALVYGRTEMDFLEEQFRLLGATLFAREHLCVWDPPPPSGDSLMAVDVAAWSAAADADAARGSDVSFGVDIGEDRLAHIGVAWRRPDGHLQVMLADSGLSPIDAPDRLADLVEQWRGKVVLGGPATALQSSVPDAEVMSSLDFGAACGAFNDQLSGGLLHHGNQDALNTAALNTAVEAARWRPVGTAGERAFQLKDAPTVGPLAAVVRAMWGVVHPKQAPVFAY
jgi:hypothetical protein